MEQMTKCTVKYSFFLMTAEKCKECGDTPKTVVTKQLMIPADMSIEDVQRQYMNELTDFFNKKDGNRFRAISNMCFNVFNIGLYTCEVTKDDIND